MKRRELIDKIAAEAARRDVRWRLKRKGANHDVYELGGGKLIPIERHRELDNSYARMVYKECAEILGEGWWK